MSVHCDALYINVKQLFTTFPIYLKNAQRYIMIISYLIGAVVEALKMSDNFLDI